MKIVKELFSEAEIYLQQILLYQTLSIVLMKIERLIKDFIESFLKNAWIFFLIIAIDGNYYTKLFIVCYNPSNTLIL